jgi:hypothetical protein
MGRDGIYAGLSGATLETDEFELGHGLKISKTFAHLMAPFLMAFAPAPPGKHHPGPLSAVSGGMGFDILAERKRKGSSLLLTHKNKYNKEILCQDH